MNKKNITSLFFSCQGNVDALKIIAGKFKKQLHAQASDGEEYNLINIGGWLGEVDNYTSFKIMVKVNNHS